MRLLGTYPNQLSQFQYQELLSLLENSLSQGEYGGGRLFDAAAVAGLQEQARDFTSLPVVAAGQRATAESMTYPLSILQARYAAIAKERTAFLQRLDRLLQVLEKDGALLRQLLAAARLEDWLAVLIKHPLFAQYTHDFVASTGDTSSAVDLSDPSLPTTVLFEKPVRPASFLFNGSSEIHAGLAAPASIREIAPIEFTWTTDATGEMEVLSGPEWARLTVLSSQPAVTFGSPVVKVLSPPDRSISGNFEIRGTSQSGNISILVRTFEVQRRRQKQFTAYTGALLSDFRASKEDVLLVDTEKSYEMPADFDVDLTADRRGSFVASPSVVGKTVTATFTEFVPAFQSSLNGSDWSPVIVFDPQNPAEDQSAGWLRNLIEENWFPLLDEKGRDLGMQIRMTAPPTEHYLFQIDTPVQSVAGVRATLKVDFDRPAYMNGLFLEPMSVFPMRLERVLGQDFSSSTKVLFHGDAVVSDQVTVRFARQLIKTVYLTFRQDTYTQKEHILDSPDKLRREVQRRLQSFIPVAARRTLSTAVTRRKTGLQYQFGLLKVAGQDWQNYPFSPTAIEPGVAVLGPFEVTGLPEILVFDAQYTGTVDFYAYLLPFDQAGSSITGFEAAIKPGAGLSVLDLPEFDPGPFDSNQPSKPVGGAVKGALYQYIETQNLGISKTRIYVKALLRTADAVLERVSLQVSRV